MKVIFMLRKFKKFLSRAVPVLLLCCMFILFFSPAVSAAGVDYKDYISNIEVDGHNDLVTITIPASEQYWVFEDLTDGYPPQTFPQGWLDFQGELVEGSDVDYHKYRIQLHPFNGRLNLADIPNNAKYTAGFRFLYSWNTGYETPYVSCNEQYYDLSGHWLGQLQNGVGREPFEANAFYEVSGKIDKDGPYQGGVTGSAASVDLFLQLNDFSPLSDAWVSFQALDFTMTFTISSLYELQQTQEKTNQLLEAVEYKLEQNGQKLDEIINGEVTPDLPEGSDTVTDLEDAEGSLRDDAQAGLDEGTQLQQNVLEILLEYTGAFAIYSRIVGLFTNIPFFYGLLAVSLALGSVSVILSIGVSAGHTYSKAQAKSGKKGG